MYFFNLLKAELRLMGYSTVKADFSPSLASLKPDYRDSRATSLPPAQQDGAWKELCDDVTKQAES